MIFEALDGRLVCIRLATVDEVIDSNRRAIAKTFMDGDGPRPITRAEAAQLVRPTP